MFGQMTHRPFRLFPRLFHSTSAQRILNGSALEKASYDEMVIRNGGEKFSILITDPPYCRLVRRRKLGDERERNNRSRIRKLDSDDTTLRFENMSHYAQFTNSWLSAALEHGLQPKADLIIWTNPLGKATITRTAHSFDYELIGEYQWAKKSSASASSNANEIMLRLHESALIFQHTSSHPHPRTLGTTPDCPPPTAVITDQIAHEHPCHKPLAVMEPLIRFWTSREDRILDCFAGSGGVVQAALKAGRGAYGIELSPYWAARCTETNVAVLGGKVHGDLRR